MTGRRAAAADAADFFARGFLTREAFCILRNAESSMSPPEMHGRRYGPPGSSDVDYALMKAWRWFISPLDSYIGGFCRFIGERDTTRCRAIVVFQGSQYGSF